MLISIVVPTYDEEGNIDTFYARVSAVLEPLGYDWEMIFVNDGSRDNTIAEILALRERDERVKLVSLSRNFGSYSAITAGFVYARGNAIASISADLQDPPELIAEFVKRWEAGADIVWGVRETRNDPGFKSFYANTFYWIIRRMVWPDFPPGGMDYGLFDRRVIELYNNTPYRNTIPFFAIYDMGFRQEQVLYHRQNRTVGVSKWTFTRRIKAAIDVLLDFSYTPIRIVTLFGYMVSALSIFYALLVIINRLLLGIGGAGWPSSVVIPAFLGGVNLIVLGMLGEYLWRAVEQVRERPRYIIMEQDGFSSDHRPGLHHERYRPHSHHRQPAENDTTA